MAEGKVPILESCRSALRLLGSRDFDEEILDLIEAARAKMRAGGVRAEVASDDADPLVRVAIKCYVKGAFGMDNPDAERYMASFESMVAQMASAGEWRAEP